MILPFQDQAPSKRVSFWSRLSSCAFRLVRSSDIETFEFLRILRADMTESRTSRRRNRTRIVGSGEASEPFDLPTNNGWAAPMSVEQMFGIPNFELIQAVTTSIVFSSFGMARPRILMFWRREYCSQSLAAMEPDLANSFTASRSGFRTMASDLGNDAMQSLADSHCISFSVFSSRSFSKLSTRASSSVTLFSKPPSWSIIKDLISKRKESKCFLTAFPTKVSNNVRTTRILWSSTSLGCHNPGSIFQINNLNNLIITDGICTYIKYLHDFI